MASEDNKQSDADLLRRANFHMWRRFPYVEAIVPVTIKPDAIEAAVEVNGWNGQVRIRRFRIRHCSPPQHSKVQERLGKITSSASYLRLILRSPSRTLQSASGWARQMVSFHFQYQPV